MQMYFYYAALLFSPEQPLNFCLQEERDHINAVVYTKENKFLLFRQHKYAIPGEMLSPVGGYINNKESPFEAARREVLEELGVGSKQSLERLGSSNDPTFPLSTDAIVLDEYGIADGNVSDDEPQWIFLGRYRTAANRGGGFLYAYLLVDAVPLVKDGGTANFVRTGDAEKQELISLSMEQVEAALVRGEFKEVKWTAAISLALLHLQKRTLKHTGRT
jgi:8-oxo-dGTP pyrophosphatase MutT (NUDIX family)